MNESLMVISGMVSGLAVHADEEAFVSDTGQRVAGIGAATGLALEGLGGVAVGAGQAASSARDAVQLFTCKLGEQVVQGRFSKVTFKDGEALDMVIAKPRNGLPLVLATRRSSDRVLWMAPHCSRGTLAHRNFSWQLAFHVFFWLLLGATLFSFGMEYINAQPGQFSLSFVLFMLAIGSSLAAIAAPYYAIRFYRQWLPFAHQAESIFAALGYPDPSRVDLPREHKRYCKFKGIGWPYNVNNGVDAGPWTYHYLEPQRDGFIR
jgi:hypothetical protein